jgi:hypothetical protein
MARLTRVNAMQGGASNTIADQPCDQFSGLF